MSPQDQKPVKPNDHSLSDSARPVRPPAIDVYESEDQYLVIADVPGATQENVTLHIEENQLTLIAMRASTSEEEPTSSEYPLADYSRSLRLPDGLDESQANAVLRDGVLSVFIPKAEAAKPHRIEVRAG